MTLEERLTRRGIVNVTASARKGIFDGQHEEDCTSLLNPTFMDDLAVLFEGDTPEKMMAKLSSALQTVKEVCQENALILNISAGKTEAIVLIQGAVLTVPAPRTPNWRPGAPQLTLPQLRWGTQFSGTGQSQRRSGRAWRGPQSTEGSSTKLENGRA